MLLLTLVAAFQITVQPPSTVVLRDSRDSLPVSSALVVPIDIKGRALAAPLAALTNGRVALPTVGAPVSRLRVLRIGQSPVEVALPRDAGRLVTIYLPYQPVQLATVRIRGRSRCVATGEASRELAFVLDEVDKALQLSTSQARQVEIVARAVLTTHEVDFLTGKRQAVESSTLEGNSTRPFQSVPIALIEREGYATIGADGSTYRAPDADVLLSPSFRETHCFRLVEGERTDSSQIGVRFEPVGRVRNRVDVQGTMWVDRERAQLRHVEFEYTGLPFRQPDRRAGGELRIEYLPSGIAFVRSWEIRMPILREERRTTLTASARSAERTLGVSGHRIEGGEVLELASGGTTLFRGRAVVDSSRTLGSSAPRVAPVSAVSGPCAAEADTLAVVRGVLIGDSAAFPSPRTITATWREQFAVSRRSDISWREESRVTSTSDARFILCGVPTDRRITLRVTNDNGLLSTTTVQIPARAVEVSAELPLRAAVAASRADRRSVVRIVDANGQPIPYATVLPASLTARIADDSGRVALSAAERSGRLEVRRIGFASASFAEIPEDVAELRLQPLVATLGAVRTVADRDAALEQRGFYRRALQAQRGAFTAEFLSPEMLDARARAQLSELLLGQRWISFARSPRGRRYLTGRGGCTMSVVLDGVPVAPGEENVVPIDDVSPGGAVMAIEVYASAANAPPELTGVTGYNSGGGGACGIVAIWTGGR